jgi:hypothetical protein
MAAKGWWIGCGALVVFALVVIGLGIAFVASRARDVSRGIDQARERYESLEHDFPFSPPADGVLAEAAFGRFLEARRAIQSTLAPSDGSLGFFEKVSMLTSLPDRVSQAHAEALRRVSSSLAEYRWIARQVYTTIAAESNRPDGDPAVARLRSLFAEHEHRTDRQPFGFHVSSTREDPFDSGLVDLSWLRIPDETRRLVSAHAGALEETSGVFVVDAFLLNVDFTRAESPSHEAR